MADNQNQALYFGMAYNAIDHVIPFNPAWANGTGYFDFAVRGPNRVELPPGVAAKSTTRDGRQMIFVGTRFGTVVLFQRYADILRDNILVHNAPREINQLGLFATSGMRSSEDVVRIVGNYEQTDPNNLGMLIEKIFKLDETMRLKKVQLSLEDDDE